MIRLLSTAAVALGCIGGVILVGACGDGTPSPFGAGGVGGEGSGGRPKTCVSDADCGSSDLICERNTCIDANCVDGQTNGTETDSDCGGAGCLPCDNGSHCQESSDCAGLFCDANESCAACEQHDDCAAAPGTYCVAGACVPQKTAGEDCDDAAECASGFCPGDDGVCCDRSCDATCEACVITKTVVEDGTCAPVARGFDPEIECQAEGVSTCGAKGDGCNGDAEAPGCVLYEAGVLCSGASCVDGQAMVSLTCDGSGTCTSGNATPCAPYACDAAGTACQTTCTDHDDCDADHYCSGDTCVPKKAPGDGCSEAAQCASGSCPEDDLVCCDAACDSTCLACLASKTGGANGTCDFVSNNTDPDNDCGTLQTCNSNGMCSL